MAKKKTKTKTTKTKKPRNKKYTPKKAVSTVPDVGQIQPQQQPIRMLVWGASPHVITGFGNMMRQILKRLYRKYPGQYHISQMGINYFGDPIDEFELTGGLQNGRYQQWPAAPQRAGLPMSHMFGQARFLELLRSHPVDFDIVFLAEDPFWLGGVIPTDPPDKQRVFIDEIRNGLASRNRAYIPIIGYFPIDGVPDPMWANHLAKFDFPITYLRFGAESIIRKNKDLNGRVHVVPLGADFEEFHPLSQEEIYTYKRALFGEENKDKYVVLNCNRNQPRKFIPANMMAFKHFHDKYPDSILYLHMKSKDVGWDLARVARNLGLEVGKNVFFPANFNINRGVPVTELNKIFNISDMLTTAALGGGWELAVTQAFCTKTVTVVPNNTSHSELCAEERGVLYNCGNRLSHLAILAGDNDVLRPLPDTEHMIDRMMWVRENPDEVNKITENAYNWAQENIAWDGIIDQWHSIFSQARNLRFTREKQVREEMQARQVQQKDPQQAKSQGQEASILFEEDKKANG